VYFAHFTEWGEGRANGFNGRLERKISDVQTISHAVDSRGGSNIEMEKAPPFQQAVRIRRWVRGGIPLRHLCHFAAKT
jgi:hypothetical protein